MSERLPLRWRRLLRARRLLGPRVLIALGTFLSARADVVGRCARGVFPAFPDALVIAAAASPHEVLANLNQDRLVVCPFVPQIGLLPEMDLVNHH